MMITNPNRRLSEVTDFTFSFLLEQLPSINNDRFKQIVNEHYPQYFNIHSKENHKQFQPINSLVYHDILQNYTDANHLINGNLFYVIKNLNLRQRCQLYFNQNPSVDPTHDIPFDRMELQDWEGYKEEAISRLKRERRDKLQEEKGDGVEISDDDIEITTEDIDKILDKYNEAKRRIELDEQLIHDYLTHVKVFNRCFLNEDDETFFTQQQKLVAVLTIKDSHREVVIRLIHLLRYLKNDLPIQIIYQQESISYETKYQIIQACSSRFDNLPIQKVTFVNVTPAIHPDYAHKFESFANKILAVLFNTFEEIILIDADTVLTQPPRSFFNLSKYQSFGTLFFRDRTTVEYRPKDDIEFFKKLMNNQLDEILFNLPQNTDFTFSNPFFEQNLSHIMESGLVLINRKMHFDQALIMATMNFFAPVGFRMYGEKELFWLSLAITGNENYQFNEHPAAAIGEYTPDWIRSKDFGDGKEHKFLSKEICANHPAHISDEDNHTLLWFNSGFKFCNQENANLDDEFGHKNRYMNLKTLEAFKTFMNNKIRIKSAIVPPKQKIHAPNDIGEADRSWAHFGQYCGGYTWCAYSSIGEAKTKEERGLVINFTPAEVKHFEKIGDVWMGEFDYRSGDEIESQARILVDLDKGDREMSDNEYKERVEVEIAKMIRRQQELHPHSVPHSVPPFVPRIRIVSFSDIGLVLDTVYVSVLIYNDICTFG
ncbi:uncharacterized protein J8A68_004943 [[Candida] subhashii]|uniref:Glycosyltransferase family 71 protein n=1 Tax=[Candida] subhashii TaxID=561895 RepID=A0A8J5Q4R0_9ASCO|nr:uncharacterized protein J8A68_004943 [[Candida] subhashii]KAG7661574.1 hypothetical protein J8A68_004943 [[Candida] subhashii]